MKNYSIVFLVAALIIGMIGFGGIGFEGNELIGIFSLLFLGIFLISMVVPTLFPAKKLRYQQIRNDKGRRI